MSTKTGPLTYENMPNKKASWDDFIHTVGEQATMFLALLKEGPAVRNAVHNWPARDLESGGYGGTLDGKPAGGNAKRRDYGSLANAVEFNREEWQVSNYGEDTDAYGVAAKQQKVEQKAAALIRLRNGMEKLFLSEQDAGIEAGETPFKCRGIGKVLANSGHAATFPIPSDLVVPSACIHAGTVAAFTEATMEGMLSAASTQMESAVTYDAFVGPILKRQMDNFAARDPVASSTNVALRQFNQNAKDGEFANMIDVFKFSVGMVRAHINHHLFCDSTGARDSVLSAGGGYFLDMKRYRVAFMRSIYHKDLPDNDQGPNGVYGYRATLVYGVPKGQCMVRPSALS